MCDCAFCASGTGFDAVAERVDLPALICIPFDSLNIIAALHCLSGRIQFKNKTVESFEEATEEAYRLASTPYNAYVNVFDRWYINVQNIGYVRIGDIPPYMFTTNLGRLSLRFKQVCKHTPLQPRADFSYVAPTHFAKVHIKFKGVEAPIPADLTSVPSKPMYKPYRMNVEERRTIAPKPSKRTQCDKSLVHKKRRKEDDKPVLPATPTAQTDEHDDELLAPICTFDPTQHITEWTTMNLSVYFGSKPAFVPKLLTFHMQPMPSFYVGNSFYICTFEHPTQIKRSRSV